MLQPVTRAKIPPPVKPNPERKLVCVTKCEKQCPVCPYIKEGKTNKKTKSKFENYIQIRLPYK